MDLKERILLKVRQTDYVSFVELGRIDGFSTPIETDGVAIELKPNVVIWVGMAPEATKAIRDLIEAKLVHMHPSQFMVYLLDGGTLKMPLATPKGVARGYKKPHWLPVTLRPGWPKEKKSKKATSGDRNVG